MVLKLPYHHECSDSKLSASDNLEEIVWRKNFFTFESNATALDSQMWGDGVQSPTVIWLHRMDFGEAKSNS